MATRMFQPLGATSADLCMCTVPFICCLEACLKYHKNITEKDVEKQVGEVLKYAPIKIGGTKHKVWPYVGYH